MDKKKIIRIIMIAVCELLIIASVVFFSIVRESGEFVLSGASLSEEATDSVLTETDGTIIIDNPDQIDYDAAEKIVFEPVVLPKGSFDVTINYETGASNNFFSFSSDKDSCIDALYSEDLTGWLPSVANKHTSHIRMMEDGKELILQVFYQGEGRLSIQGVNIHQTNSDVIWRIIGVIILIIILDICIIKRKFIADLFSVDNYHYTMGIVLLILIASLPAFVNGIYIGDDTRFHITRMEGLKEAILSLQFPAKMHSTHLFGYGYATGQMYPQLFLYPEALLRIFGVSRVGAHRFLILIVNSLTSCITFYSLNKIFKSRSVAFAGAILYTLAPYRILDLYIRDSMGEYCAMIGLPLIVWGLYSFVAEDNADKKPAVADLAIGYTIVIESHLLTILFAGIISVFIGMIFIRRILNKDKMVSLLQVIVLTVCLNAVFMVPLFDLMRLPMNEFTEPMKAEGIDITQLFTNSVLQDSEDLSSNDTIEKLGMIRIDGEKPYAIGYALLVTTGVFILYLRKRKEYRRLGIVALCLGIVSAAMSLYVFPWEKIEKTGAARFLLNVQFPWRFIMFATIAFLITGCIGISYLMQKMSGVAVVLIVGLVALFGFTNITDYLIEKVPIEADAPVDQMDLGVIGEYLIKGTEADRFISQGEHLSFAADKLEISEYEKLGTDISFFAVNKSGDIQTVDLPLTMYPGYQAKDRDGNKLDVTYGNNQVVRIILPGSFDNTVCVWYGGKWYWKAATLISLLTVVFLIWKKSFNSCERSFVKQ